MAEINVVQRHTEQPEVVDRAKDFWSRYGRLISIAALVLGLLAIGYFIYTQFFQKPNEQKASDSILMPHSRKLAQES
jgi:hypothetical protein